MGDLVLVFLPYSNNQKIWQGLCRVVEKRSEVDYIIEKDSNVKLVHIDLLRKFGQQAETQNKSKISKGDVHTVCAVLENKQDKKLENNTEAIANNVPCQYKKS